MSDVIRTCKKTFVPFYSLERIRFMKEYVSNYKTCIDRFPSSRFVYTFVYEDPKNNFEEFINKQQTGKWTLCDIYDTDQNELFEHISSLVSGNTGNLKNTLAVSMKHKEYCEIQLEYKDKDCEFKFCLKNVWLILFKTKVGFIVVDTCIDRDSDPDKLITLNYYMKSLKLINNYNKNLTRLETIKETIKRYDENNNDLFHQLNITSLSDGEKLKSSVMGMCLRP